MTDGMPGAIDELDLEEWVTPRMVVISPMQIPMLHYASLPVLDTI
jgi:hypothetical protein